MGGSLEGRSYDGKREKDTGEICPAYAEAFRQRQELPDRSGRGDGDQGQTGAGEWAAAPGAGRGAEDGGVGRR